MTPLTIVLIVIGILFWVAIIFMIFGIWKYLRLKKQDKENNRTKKQDEPIEKRFKLGSFEVPVSYRSVHAQQPFMAHELEMTGVTVTAPVSEISVRYLGKYRLALTIHQTSAICDVPQKKGTSQDVNVKDQSEEEGSQRSSLPRTRSVSLSKNGYKLTSGKNKKKKKREKDLKIEDREFGHSSSPSPTGSEGSNYTMRSSIKSADNFHRTISMTSLNSDTFSKKSLAENVYSPMASPKFGGEKRISATAIELKQQKIFWFMTSCLNKQGKAKQALANRRSFARSHHLSLDESFNGSISETDSFGSISGDDREDHFKDNISVDGRRKRLGMRRKSSTERRAYRKSGHVTFTTEYNQEKQTLNIHVIRIMGLASNRDASEIHPFVRLYLEPGKKQRQQTQRHRNTKEPYINEVIQFTNIGVEDLAKYKMKMKVYSRGNLRKTELLGEIDVALSSMNRFYKDTFAIDLYVKRSQISLSTIEVSVCHQATFNKLEVIVQNAKNLPGKVSTLNPYVTVSLFKENAVEQKDTAAKQGTNNPIFDESLSFDICTSLNEPLSATYALVITINNRNMLGKDEVLGHVIISSLSIQKDAAEYWKRVEDSPHKKLFGFFTFLDPKEI